MTAINILWLLFGSQGGSNPEDPPIGPQDPPFFMPSAIDTNYTGSWRAIQDVVTGWDWSMPATHQLAAMSGMFQFTAPNFPANFPGRVIAKYDADWKIIEPTEGNFDFSKLTAHFNNYDWVQLDVRQTCRSYDSTAAGAKGRQTCPDWLKAKLPTQDVHWCNDIYGQTTYFPWHPTYQTYHMKMMNALLGEPCASYPSGYRIDGYRVHQHPRLMFSLLHGLGGNSEELVGTAFTLVKNNPTIAAGYLDFLKRHWIDKWGADKAKLSFVGIDRPWTTLISPLLQYGIGTRGGAVESWLGWNLTPSYADAPFSTGIKLLPYTNSSGTTITNINGLYPVYLGIDYTNPLMNQSLPAVHSQDQNEVYSFTTSITNDTAGLPPPLRHQQNWRMAMLRCLQMRRNNIAVEKINSQYNAYGGSENLINPKMMGWVTMNSGHKDADALEAWCCLTKFPHRGWNSISNQDGNMEIHNLECLLHQREIYGATTVDGKRGHGVNSSVENGGTADTDWNSTKNDTVLGYKLYPWSPGFDTDDTKFPRTLWHIYLSRRGPKIGLKLNTDFLSGNRPIAVKVVYFDRSTEEWRLRYRNSSNITVDKSITGGGTNLVKTATFFCNDFSTAPVGTADIILVSGGNTPFCFVRVIKI